MSMRLGDDVARRCTSQVHASSLSIFSASPIIDEVDDANYDIDVAPAEEALDTGFKARDISPSRRLMKVLYRDAASAAISKEKMRFRRHHAPPKSFPRHFAAIRARVALVSLMIRGKIRWLRCFQDDERLTLFGRCASVSVGMASRVDCPPIDIRGWFSLRA